MNTETNFKTGDWTRTCQECGHKQKAQQPSQRGELTETYQNALCKRCKSMGLDYGKTYQELNNSYWGD